MHIKIFSVASLTLGALAAPAPVTSDTKESLEPRTLLLHHVGGVHGVGGGLGHGGGIAYEGHGEVLAHGGRVVYAAHPGELDRHPYVKRDAGASYDSALEPRTLGRHDNGRGLGGGLGHGPVITPGIATNGRLIVDNHGERLVHGHLRKRLLRHHVGLAHAEAERVERLPHGAPPKGVGAGLGHGGGIELAAPAPLPVPALPPLPPLPAHGPLPALPALPPQPAPLPLPAAPVAAAPVPAELRHPNDVPHAAPVPLAPAPLTPLPQPARLAPAPLAPLPPMEPTGKLARPIKPLVRRDTLIGPAAKARSASQVVNALDFITTSINNLDVAVKAVKPGSSTGINEVVAKNNAVTKAMERAQQVVRSAGDTDLPGSLAIQQQVVSLSAAGNRLANDIIVLQPIISAAGVQTKFVDDLHKQQALSQQVSDSVVRTIPNIAQPLAQSQARDMTGSIDRVMKVFHEAASAASAAPAAPSLTPLPVVPQPQPLQPLPPVPAKGSIPKPISQPLPQPSLVSQPAQLSPKPVQVQQPAQPLIVLQPTMIDTPPSGPAPKLIPRPQVVAPQPMPAQPALQPLQPAALAPAKLQPLHPDTIQPAASAVPAAPAAPLTGHEGHEGHGAGSAVTQPLSSLQPLPQSPTADSMIPARAGSGVNSDDVLMPMTG